MSDLELFEASNGFSRDPASQAWDDAQIQQAAQDEIQERRYEDLLLAEHNRQLEESRFGEDNFTQDLGTSFNDNFDTNLSGSPETETGLRPTEINRSCSSETFHDPGSWSWVDSSNSESLETVNDQANWDTIDRNVSPTSSGNNSNRSSSPTSSKSRSLSTEPDPFLQLLRGLVVIVGSLFILMMMLSV